MGTPTTGLTLPLAAAVALVMAGCAAESDAPPELVVDRSLCGHCSMLISEPSLAAAYRAGGEERLFDDIGCLVAALSERDTSADVETWFGDLDGSGWIRAADAVFVRSATLRTPMGGGIAAVRTTARAEELAAEHRGSVTPTLEHLLAAVGTSHGH